VKFHGDTERIEQSSTTSSVMETRAGEEAVKGIVCLVGWIGSGGDATGSCVDRKSLTQAAAPYIPSALKYSNKSQSATILRKLPLIHQLMNQPLTQLNEASLVAPL